MRFWKHFLAPTGHMGQKHANASCIVAHIGLKSKTGTKTIVHPSHFTKHEKWTVLFCWMQIWFRCFSDSYERTFDILQCYTQQRTIKRKTPNKKDMTISNKGYDPPNQKTTHHFHRIFPLFRGNLTFIGKSPPAPPVALTRISLRSVGLVRWKKRHEFGQLFWCDVVFPAVMVSHANI